jgi:hypothetical protein
MSTNAETKQEELFDTTEALSRRRLLAHAGLGAMALAGLSALSSPARAGHGNSMDQAIVQAAATAEALATTMYYNIIKSSLYTSSLLGNVNDQAYLVAGYEEELNHYNLLSSVYPALALTFYFPTGMFTVGNDQTTMNTLITLEDAFVAAYLIGVRDFSSAALKVLASQIMGVEAEHRTLGRVICADLGFSTVSGLAGPEKVQGSDGAASNNLAYERTFSSDFPNIGAVVTALLPFVSPGASGFSTTPFHFSDATGLAQTITLNDTTP